MKRQDADIREVGLLDAGGGPKVCVWRPVPTMTKLPVVLGLARLPCGLRVLERSLVLMPRAGEAESAPSLS